jgi:hypothetical protein
MRAALVPPPTFLPFDELVIARFYRDIVIYGAWFNLQKSLLVVNISILVLRLDRSLWIAQCSTSSYEAEAAELFTRALRLVQDLRGSGH